MGFLKSLSIENGRPNFKSVSTLENREVEEDFMPNYVCVTVCLVVKTIVVWESSKLPCCWHDLQALECVALGLESGLRDILVAPM